MSKPEKFKGRIYRDYNPENQKDLEFVIEFDKKDQKRKQILSFIAQIDTNEEEKINIFSLKKENKNSIVFSIKAVSNYGCSLSKNELTIKLPQASKKQLLKATGIIAINSPYEETQNSITIQGFNDKSCIIEFTGEKAEITKKRLAHIKENKNQFKETKNNIEILESKNDIDDIIEQKESNTSFDKEKKIQQLTKNNTSEKPDLKNNKGSNSSSQISKLDYEEEQKKPLTIPKKNDGEQYTEIGSKIRGLYLLFKNRSSD